ncbi:hypothetical protein RF11_12889 [Thelohanellus kitauei]|uniref:Uncharacterized protein n=1 Tax=Thelohanellus kitauei TaxID=669202 RepID=A0A0C2I8B1_THEKT|nr:hypothetical protein RF11_12889 [Thelohanellus kitauei]
MNDNNQKLNTVIKRKGEGFLCREYKSDWVDSSMLVPNSFGKHLYLICGICVSHIQIFNLDSHITKKHSEINDKYPLKSDLRKENSTVITNANEHSKSAALASYDFALLLACKKNPFTEAEEIIKPAPNISA